MADKDKTRGIDATIAALTLLFAFIAAFAAAFVIPDVRAWLKLDPEKPCVEWAPYSLFEHRQCAKCSFPLYFSHLKDGEGSKTPLLCRDMPVHAKATVQLLNTALRQNNAAEPGRQAGVTISVERSGSPGKLSKGDLLINDQLNSRLSIEILDIQIPDDGKLLLSWSVASCKFDKDGRPGIPGDCSGSGEIVISAQAVSEHP